MTGGRAPCFCDLSVGEALARRSPIQEIRRFLPASGDTALDQSGDLPGECLEQRRGRESPMDKSLRTPAREAWNERKGSITTRYVSVWKKSIQLVALLNWFPIFAAR